MIPPYAIPDVYILDLKRVDDHLVLLCDKDHLLRRFGQLDYRELKRGEETPVIFRAVADEVWSVISGKVTLTLVDKREDSPSENQSLQFHLSKRKPQSVLIPFGVAYHIRAITKARLIRLATHADGSHPGDLIFPASEFASILSSR